MRVQPVFVWAQLVPEAPVLAALVPAAFVHQVHVQVVVVLPVGVSEVDAA